MLLTCFLKEVLHEFVHAWKCWHVHTSERCHTCEITVTSRFRWLIFEYYCYNHVLFDFIALFCCLFQLAQFSSQFRQRRKPVECCQLTLKSSMVPGSNSCEHEIKLSPTLIWNFFSLTVLDSIKRNTSNAGNFHWVLTIFRKSQNWYWFERFWEVNDIWSKNSFF